MNQIERDAVQVAADLKKEGISTFIRNAAVMAAKRIASRAKK